MIRWFIGYDRQESLAAYVLAHSIQSRSSMPVSLTFLNRENLKGIFNRKRSEVETTDFSISRFLVPYLCNYEGWSIFTDCDMILQDDPAKLWAWRDDRYSVRVVKHNYIPREGVKWLGKVQTRYEKKNWSSVMLLNTGQCKSLTVDYVNHVSGLDLHQFKWTTDDKIGDLPAQWNHLVGYDVPGKASLLHYTTGGPYFNEFKLCEFSEEWFDEYRQMIRVDE